MVAHLLFEVTGVLSLWGEFVVGVSAHRYGWVLVVKSEINGGAGRLPSRLRTGQSLWCCCCCLVLLEDRGMLISFFGSAA